MLRRAPGCCGAPPTPRTGVAGGRTGPARAGRAARRRPLGLRLRPAPALAAGRGRQPRARTGRGVGQPAGRPGARGAAPRPPAGGHGGRLGQRGQRRAGVGAVGVRQRRRRRCTWRAHRSVTGCCWTPAPGWRPPATGSPRRCSTTARARSAAAPRRWSSDPSPRLVGMPQLRLALAQVDAVVGDLAGNAAHRPRAGPRRAADAGAHLVAFPEMVLTGYPVEDLALRRSFVDASRAARARSWPPTSPTDGLGELPVVVGYLDRAQGPDATSGARATESARTGAPASPRAAAELRGRAARRPGRRPLRQAPPAQLRRLRRVPHTSCPARPDRSCGCRGVDVALAICEDLWQDGGPVARAREAGAGLLLVINGSPYERDKDDTRLALASRRAAEAGLHAGLPQPGRRPGRAGLRRRLAGRQRRTARCSPGRRSSPRSCSSSTSTWPRRDRRPRPATCRRRASHVTR